MTFRQLSQKTEASQEGSKNLETVGRNAIKLAKVLTSLENTGLLEGNLKDEVPKLLSFFLKNLVVQMKLGIR